MNRALLLALFLPSLAFGALTNHYVASDGTDTWANSTSNLTPCSLTTALANAAAGDVVNIKAGAYARTASDAAANSGSGTQPIVWVGCDTSWNQIVPARADQTGGKANGLLVTTNFPAITYDATYGWAANTKTGHILQSLKFAGSIDGSLVYLGASSSAIGLDVTNSSTGNGPIGIRLALYGIAFRCDASCSGGSGGTSASPIALNSYDKAVGCVCKASRAFGINMMANGQAIGNVIYGHGTYGIYLSGTTVTYNITAVGNTIYGGTSGVAFADAAFTSQSVVVGNHITDGSGYGVLALNASGSPVVIAGNRIVNMAQGATSWAGDWDAAAVYNTISTAVAAGGDYVSAGAGNLNLVSGAAGLETGPMGRDCGALQRIRDYPAVTNVNPNDTVDGVTGTYHPRFFR
jgi:hypothetical protein